MNFLDVAHDSARARPTLHDVSRNALLASNRTAWLGLAQSGWNHKPGFNLVAVLSGEVTKFDSHCNGTTYGPNSPNGAVFVEYGDEPEEVRNMSSAPATVYATQVAPDADPAVFRIEDDPPPCA